MYELLTQIDPISTEQTIQYGLLGLGVGAAAGGGLSGSAIGGIIGGIGSLFGIGRGRRNHKRNIAAMKLQHSMDKDMFNYQNYYNLPKKQMQRLKDAGLNPALMYQQGTTGNASSAPMTKPLPAYQETPVDTQQIMNGAILASQVKQNNAVTTGYEIDNYIKAGGSEQEIKNKFLRNQEIEQTIENLKQQNKTEIQKTEKEKIMKEIQGIDRDFFNKHQLAPSDFGLYKGLKRAGATAGQIIEYLITGDTTGLEDIILGTDHSNNRYKIEGETSRSKTRKKY